MSNRTSLSILLHIHRALLIRLFVLDILLVFSGTGVLLLPHNTLALTLQNLTIVILIATTALIYQIHLYRTFAGSPVFYFLLPVNRRTFFLPFLVAIATPVLLLPGTAVMMYWVSRACGDTGTVSTGHYALLNYYLLLVVMLVKTLPLPLYYLYKKHIVLVPGFLVIMIFIHLATSILQELLCPLIYFPTPVKELLFVGTVIFVAARMLKLP